MGFFKVPKINRQSKFPLSTKLFTQTHCNNLKGLFINAIYSLLLAKAQTDFTACYLT